MKKWSRLTLITGVIMLILTITSIVVLIQIRTALQTSPVAEWLGVLVAALLVVLGLSHLLSLFGMAGLFYVLRRENLLRSAAFVLGFLSLFMLMADVMMLHDIGNEWASGHDVSGEWRIVLFGHGTHIVFSLLVIFQALSLRRKPVNGSPAVKDETLYLSVHQIGVVSAVFGLACALLTGNAGVPQRYIPGLLFIGCIVLLTPYAFAALCWLFSKRREKPADWYDEKQFSDICRGALFTLAVMVAVITVWYLLVTVRAVELSSFVFPVYLFSTLLLFSGSTLYFCKKG